jgi:hypothetical protein
VRSGARLARSPQLVVALLQQRLRTCMAAMGTRISVPEPSQQLWYVGVFNVTHRGARPVVAQLGLQPLHLALGALAARRRQRHLRTVKEVVTVRQT